MKFIDRLPTRPGRVKITLEDGSSYFATMERADDPTVEGTPLNAENLNRLASKSGAFEDGTTAHTKPVPADAAPYAEVVEIGGMTRKCKHIFNNWVRTEYSFSYNTNGNYDISNEINIPSAWVGKKVCYSAYFDNRNNTGVAHVGVVINSAVYRNFDTDIGVNAGSAGRAYVVLTIPSDASTIAFGISTNPNGATVFWREPMVEFGDTPTEYEPYFEGLRSAKVESVESVGVNLFDIDKREYGTIDSNGDLYFLNEVAEFYRFDTEENTQYTLSAYVRNTNTTGNGRLSVVYTDGSEDNTVLLNSNTEWAYHSFTTAVGKTVKLIRTYYGYGGAWYIRGGELMLNKGSTALPYTPYVRNTLPIPEAVQALDGYGWGIDATYRNYVDFDKKQFVKWVERKVFDGTEKWIDEGVKGTDTYYALSKIGDMNSIVDIVSICNKYDTVLFSSGNKLIGCFVANSTGYNQAQINIRPESASSMSTEKMKEMCAEWYAQGDPLTVYYALATPIITDISDILPADNIIGVEGGGTVTMVNEYGYDVPNTITFYEGKNEVVGADTFVGDLYGTAARAEVAMDVPAWAKQPSKPTYTAAEIGAAPAGFGLGLYYPEKVTNDPAIVDTWKNNGWYVFYSYDKLLIPGFNLTAYGVIRVDAGGWGYRQTFIPRLYPQYTLIRYAANDDAWSEWEWVNPPMQLGVEYRTTERMNGKAVYKKLDSSGKLLMRLDGETEWKDYVYNATNAINAVNDGEGNNIATTYMTKSEAAILGRVATGTYVGREDLAQTVTIGFKPKFITAIRQINKDRFFYIAGDGTGTFHETDTGFTTGYSTEEYRHPTNYAGETYTYFAIG